MAWAFRAGIEEQGKALEEWYCFKPAIPGQNREHLQAGSAGIGNRLSHQREQLPRLLRSVSQAWRPQNGDARWGSSPCSCSWRCVAGGVHSCHRPVWARRQTSEARASKTIQQATVSAWEWKARSTTKRSIATPINLVISKSSLYESDRDQKDSTYHDQAE